MGISTPKKPFDLKAFLSEKGKPRTVRRGYPSRGQALANDERSAQQPQSSETEPATEPAAEVVLPGSEGK